MRGDAVPTVTAAQMREIDRLMVEEIGISLEQMMENAGRAFAELACRHLRETAVVASLCLRDPVATAAVPSWPLGDSRSGEPK